MSYQDPMSALALQLHSRTQALEKQMDSVDTMNADGARTFLDAKLALQRTNMAATIGMQLRHGLLKKVTSKL
ncbi:hypothetical protein [Roseateles terrae]|uniref:Uncharacterized protein n=1 Tax=Roseateles terrae TaxID=431060 RepID=A0ABR6GQP9_9BURK|nr:hypothetical protein [Roseateles terrae]MBB3194449.1 hypothetical protein [Roseateles terrae]